MSISKKAQRAKELRRANPAKYKELDRKYSAAYWSKNPEKHKEKQRNRHYRKTYGIEYNDAMTLLAKQGWACAICVTPLRSLGGNAHVDHCHTTKKVRGILCRICNMQIGWFERWPDFYKFAAAYLRRENVV